MTLEWDNNFDTPAEQCACNTPCIQIFPFLTFCTKIALKDMGNNVESFRCENRILVLFLLFF